LLDELNGVVKWRKIFGKPNPRLKDRELILRFFALLADPHSYERPLGEFLNKFAAKNRNPSQQELENLRASFCATIDVVFDCVGEEAFRPERALNAAVFDSVMVGVARRLERGKISHPDQVKTAYRHLLANDNYVAVVTGPTADKALVDKRIELATAAFASVR
ncbi:MAG: DUF262 domain-containing protein, partial [Verrucomicrobia bacterium]|nr:DUF262 domain-containing protein [Verrucomicrobiota bacterium]